MSLQSELCRGEKRHGGWCQVHPANVQEPGVECGPVQQPHRGRDQEKSCHQKLTRNQILFHTFSKSKHILFLYMGKFYHSWQHWSGRWYWRRFSSVRRRSPPWQSSSCPTARIMAPSSLPTIPSEWIMTFSSLWRQTSAQDWRGNLNSSSSRFVNKSLSKECRKCIGEIVLCSRVFIKIID